MQNNRLPFSFFCLVIVAVVLVCLTGCATGPTPAAALGSVRTAFPDAQIYVSTDDPEKFTVVEGSHAYSVECVARYAFITEIFIQTK